MDTYPQAEGAQVTATEIPYAALTTLLRGVCARGPGAAWSRIEITRQGVAERRSGISGFRLLRLNGSAFQGFVRDRVHNASRHC